MPISKNCFYQGLRQEDFFHGVPLEDDCYDMNKDIVDENLFSVSEDEEDDAKNAEGQGDNLGAARMEVEPSVKKVIQPL